MARRRWLLFSSRVCAHSRSSLQSGSSGPALNGIGRASVPYVDMICAQAKAGARSAELQLSERNGREMIRRLITIASAISLLLCVAVSALWARGYWHRDACSFHYRGEHWELVSQRGRIRADNQPERDDQIRQYDEDVRLWVEKTHKLDSAHDQAVRALDHPDANDPRHRKAWRRAYDTLIELDQSFNSEPRPTAVSQYVAHSGPDSIALIVTAMLPLVWLAQRFRLRSSDRGGLCTACGYDLRASKHRCPECGTPISGGQTPIVQS